MEHINYIRNNTFLFYLVLHNMLVSVERMEVKRFGVPVVLLFFLKNFLLFC